MGNYSPFGCNQQPHLGSSEAGRDNSFKNDYKYPILIADLIYAEKDSMCAVDPI